MAPPDSGENFMNTESLSGGEKSVSTVAFLMALWSHMDLPFYSMDEYDVFMVSGTFGVGIFDVLVYS